MRIQNTLRNRLRYSKVYDENGKCLGFAKDKIPYELMIVYKSLIDFPDINDKDIKWCECPFCGYRSTNLSGHIRKFHPEHKNDKSFKRVALHASPLSKENWISTNCPDLPKEEAEAKYQEWRNSHNMNQGWGTGERNHNHRSNASEEKRKSMSPRCIEFWLRKGLSQEEAEKARNEWYDDLLHNKIVSSTSLEHFLQQTNGDVEKARELQRKRQATNSPRKLIEKYGVEEGTIRYAEKIQKWSDLMHEKFNKGYSQTEIEFSEWIISSLELDKNICSYANHRLECRIPLVPDFIYNDTYIIEFYGDYWHANPELFTEDDYINAKFSVKSIRKKDKLRESALKTAGYKLLVVWEHDYRTNPEIVLQRIKEFLDVS